MLYYDAMRYMTTGVDHAKHVNSRLNLPKLWQSGEIDHIWLSAN
jgi:hypothetical protein